tara:strand:+ start:3474 stop:4430 length:957 start_codon:yes stop_codon:yes gene_type:complete
VFVNRTSPYKSNQFLWLVFKLLIVILSGYFIYDILANSAELKFTDFYSKLNEFDVFSVKNITFLLFLTIINWILEIAKWKILIKRVNNISWFEATKQSLTSLTFSLITPNRIGEYGAKALYFKKEKRKEILLLNFTGNFYQLVSTTIFGLVGILYLIDYFSFSFITLKNTSILFVGIGVGFLLIHFLQKKFELVGRWITKVKDALKLKKNMPVLFLSLLRYVVFSHQFYFLIRIFTIDISYWNAMAGITSMYLIASLIPMLSIFDFVLKGSVAIFVFSFFEINPMLILSITTSMWVFNFAFPAIIGNYFVLQFKPVKQ